MEGKGKERVVNEQYAFLYYVKLVVFLSQVVTEEVISLVTCRELFPEATFSFYCLRYFHSIGQGFEDT